MKTVCLDNILDIYDFCPDIYSKYLLLKSIAKYCRNSLCTNYLKKFNEMIIKTKYFEEFKYIKEQSTYMCLVAIQQNGLNLQYIKEQTEKICLVAVQQNGIVLKYV